MQKDLTKGSIFKILLQFSIPYLLSSFLQTFYGMADLFVSGQFHGADTISAVSVGSQVMHMMTVIIVGMAMGSTVLINRALGEKDIKKAQQTIGNTISFFMLFSAALTAILLACVQRILTVMSVPAEAFEETKLYLMICFSGVPFITAYNIISCIFRGMGDSKSPLYFVAVACVLNIILDFLLIGCFGMGASGAALATVISQTVSVVTACAAVKRKKFGLSAKKEDLYLQKDNIFNILKIGLPIAFQDGFIQISFLVITVIANQRGVVVAASVGIVEKIISFLFLVPSAMLSSISSIAAQNVGAGKYERAAAVLKYGIMTGMAYGIVIAFSCQFLSQMLLSFFTEETGVIIMGAQYLRSYSLDCILVAVHFSFSGFFCAYGYSGISFFYNLVSILLLRIPGAYLASRMYPDTLYPMGLAAPAGSLLSSVICIVVFIAWKKKFLPPKEASD